LIIDNSTSTGLAGDLTDLRASLARHPFPTSQDEILAHLVAGHEPSRLLWRAAALRRTREYYSVDEVCDDIAGSADSGMPPPPGR
jgi:hypothetical protein